MSLGEYNYDDIAGAFGGDNISKFFTMILLLGVILLGSITMINLFVAVVVSDVAQLQKDVFKRVFQISKKCLDINFIIIKNLYQMGEFCILAESILPGFILKKMRVDKECLIICLHEQCNAKENQNCLPCRRNQKPVSKENVLQCPGEKLPETYEFVNDYLKKHFKIDTK